jgi:hypothetical protein
LPRAGEFRGDEVHAGFKKGDELKAVRSRFTYANVMSTIAVFLVLGGGAAFAAAKLAKNSVGTAQLKNNAVTAAKIKDGAVTGAKVGAGAIGGEALASGAVSGGKLGDGAVTAGKLSDGAVTAGKLGDGAVTGGKLGPGSVTTDKLADGSVTAAKLAVPLPGVGVVQKLTTTASVAAPGTGIGPFSVPYPLNNPTFPQPVGEDDLLVGAVTVRFDPVCKGPRQFTADLLMADPGALGGFKALGIAIVEDQSGTEEVKTAHFGATNAGPLALLSPSSPVTRSLTIRLRQTLCGTGSPVGATASAIGARVDVIGIR